jgi:nucleotide-binding universal stress UspA family protein
MFQKILIAYDGSDHSRRAARIAGNMARVQPTSELVLVCVLEAMPSGLGQPYIDNLITDRTREGEIMLQEAREIIGGEVEVSSELLFGPPAESIMNVASGQDCDLIVMGTLGLGGLKGLLVGSQIQKVINLSTVPVLAVK